MNIKLAVHPYFIMTASPSSKCRLSSTSLDTTNVQRVICLTSIDAELSIKLLRDAVIGATGLANAIVVHRSLVALATRSSSAALDEDAVEDVALDVDALVHSGGLSSDLVAVAVVAVSYDEVVGARSIGDAAELQGDSEEAQETKLVHFEWFCVEVELKELLMGIRSWSCLLMLFHLPSVASRSTLRFIYFFQPPPIDQFANKPTEAVRIGRPAAH